MDESNENSGGPTPDGVPNWEFGPRPEIAASTGAMTTPSLAADEPTPPVERHRLVKIGVVLGAVAVLAGAAVGHFAWPSSSSSSAQPSNGAATSPFAQGDADGRGQQSQTSSAAVQAVATRVSPALVDINTNLGLQDAQAAGTGIVISSDGLVLTNNHVISGSTSITATDIGNGKTYTAVVVGYDRSHDIAVIRLQSASGLQVASFGNSDNVAVGQSVVGIGNAGGRGGTPSTAAGQVTGLDESITASDEAASTSEQLTGLIATSAGIQPGDSGGPLATMEGKVIGIDTAASANYSFSSGDAQGFAVPINQALAIAHQITAGHASSTVHLGDTAFLGVKILSSGTQGGAASSVAGATISGVVAGSPAEAAGLGQGDTITALNRTAIGSPDDLTTQLSGHHPGDKVLLTWTDAGGASHSATVTLAKGPAA